MGDPRSNSFTGAAFVFVRSETTWSRQAKLTGPVGSFGYSVALFGATAVAGAPFKNANARAAYVFRKV